MDLIYRKEKYNKYLQKIKALTDDPEMEESDRLRIMHMNIQDVLEALKSKEDYYEGRILYSILLLPLIVVLIHASLTGGLGVSFMLLVFLLLFFAYGTIRMRQTISENQSMKWNDESQELTSQVYLNNKVSYAMTALHIKELRAELLQFFYCIFFAPLMYFIADWWFSATPYAFNSVAWLVAYGISAPWWYYFFDDYKKELLEPRELLETYQEELSASI